MSFVDRMIDMHYARDSGRELFFPCMRLTRGFVVNEDLKRSINRILKPAYYVQLAAVLVWWAFVTFDRMSMATAWVIPAGIVIVYLFTAFVLAKIFVGMPDETAKAESRLFEARADAFVAERRQSRLFRWGRIVVLILLGHMLFVHLSNVTSWSDVDYGFVSVAVFGAIILVVPPSFIKKWRPRL